MDFSQINKNRLITGIIFISLLLFCSSCAYNQEYIKYTNDQIAALQKTTAELKESNKSKMDTINSNQAAIMVEIDALKKNIQDLSGRVDDNEHLIKYNLEKDLGEKDNAGVKIAERLDRLEKMVNQQSRYLNLEPVPDQGAINNSVPSVSDAGPSGSGPDTGSTANKPEDVALYDSNLALFRNEQYEQALTGFKTFLNTYPKSDLADNAQYWIGECLMALKQFEPAILAFNEVIKKYPKGNKVPNAMLRQAIAMQEINDPTSTKLLLKKLIKGYPNSPEAEIAKKKLATMK